MESMQKYCTLFPDYKFQKLVGQGSYGDVYYCIRKSDGVRVALKIIRNSDTKGDGLSITTLREIKFLRYCNHPNIVRVLDIISPNISWDSQYKSIPPLALVMEYVEYDLLGLLKSARMNYSKCLSIDAVRYIAYQLFSALAYLHKHNIIHRDLKSANILISANCEVKLADFGLSRCIGNIMKNEYTSRVITLWYRPPELILGSTYYGPEVDIWSAGCILGELLSGDTLFPNYNNNEYVQLQLIFRKCGYPKDPVLLQLIEKNHLHFNETFTRTIPQCILNSSSTTSNNLPPEAFDLLDCILQTSPSKRPTANQILQHPFFHGIDNIQFPFPQMKEEGCHDLDVFRKMSYGINDEVDSIIISKKKADLKNFLADEDIIDLCSDETPSDETPSNENTHPNPTEMSDHPSNQTPPSPSSPPASSPASSPPASPPASPPPPPASPPSTSPPSPPSSPPSPPPSPPSTSPPSSPSSSSVAAVKPMNRRVALSPVYKPRSKRSRKRSSSSTAEKVKEKHQIPNPKKPRYFREEDRQKWDAILLAEERKAEAKKAKREAAYQSRLKAKEEMELQKQIRLFQIMEGTLPPDETPGKGGKKKNQVKSTDNSKKPSKASTAVNKNTL